MLKPYDLAGEVSPIARNIIGILCVAIGSVLAISAWLTGEIVVVILTFVAGLPIGLVGFSLLLSKPKPGYGIFAPCTLYLIGVLIAAASVAGTYSGHPRTGLGILFAFGCFALAKKRSKERKSW